MSRKAIENSNGHTLAAQVKSRTRAALPWRLATPPNGEFVRRLNKSKIPFGTKENIAETSIQGHPTTVSS